MTDTNDGGVNSIITRDQLDTIVARHLQSTIISVELIDNWLPKLIIRDYPHPLVLRIWKSDDPTHYLHLALRNELGFIQYCNDVGFTNLPKIIAYDISQTIIPWDYYLYEYVEGRPMTDLIPLLTTDEKSTFYHNLGQVVALLHTHTFDQSVSITLDHEGDMVVEPEEWEFRTEHDWIRHHFEQIYELFPEYPHLQPYIPRCEELFDRFAEFRKLPPLSLSLTHNDLSSDNVIVKGKGEQLDDIMFIDLTFAGVSRISLDLGRAERRFTTWKTLLPLDEITNYSQIFFGGYTSIRPLPPEWDGERPIFHLIQLIDDIGFCFEDSDEKNWFIAHQDEILDYTEWELNRLFDLFL